jgi:hypothetical protein
MYLLSLGGNAVDSDGALLAAAEVGSVAIFEILTATTMPIVGMLAKTIAHCHIRAFDWALQRFDITQVGDGAVMSLFSDYDLTETHYYYFNRLLLAPGVSERLLCGRECIWLMLLHIVHRHVPRNIDRLMAIDGMSSYLASEDSIKKAVQMRVPRTTIRELVRASPSRHIMFDAEVMSYLRD